MPNLKLTPALRDEYQALFSTCIIRAERLAEVEGMIDRILAHEGRYRTVAQRQGIPWYVVAVIHHMEAGLRFDGHLHNGDPLNARTRHVPIGRPRRGNPPFSWEVSAEDVLNLQGLNARTDWSLAGVLYQLERYNGWGYRQQHPEVLSPYLWSYSQHYHSGKYVADGTWSARAVSRQCGAAVLLRRLAEHGKVQFKDWRLPEDSLPLVPRFSLRRPDEPAAAALAEALQHWLNGYPGIVLREDGVVGPRTAAAYRRVTGHALPGAPD